MKLTTPTKLSFFLSILFPLYLLLTYSDLLSRGYYWLALISFSSPLISIVLGAITVLRSYQGSNNKEKIFSVISVALSLISIIYISWRITWFGVLLGLSGGI